MNDLTTVAPTFLQPTTYAEFERFAKLISESDLAPKDYKGKPGNIMIALQMGYELGLQPLQALQNISVINGRAAVWGDLVIALVRSKSICKYIKEWIEGDIASNTAVAYCEVMRGTEVVRRSFSIDEARRAGLTTKPGDTWSKYPARMLQCRARGFALRDAFADVLKGLTVMEDLEADAFNPQDTDYAPVKIGNEAVKKEIIEQESNTLGSKIKSDELFEEMQNCDTKDELHTVALKIKESDLSMIDKKRLADAYRERIAFINEQKETIIQPQETNETEVESDAEK